MVLQNVIKRDGRKAPFDKSRITGAISKAMRAAEEGSSERATELADLVITELSETFDGTPPTVEQIQDVVEKILMRNGMEETAKSYILYRKQHYDIREMKSLLSSNGLIEGYLNMSDWRVKENANMSYSLQGLNSHISTAVVSNYWINKIYPKKVQDAHMSGDFHLHDLGVLGPYCVGWDLRDLLVSGFGHVRGKIASKPAKHFRSALGQIIKLLLHAPGRISRGAGIQQFRHLSCAVHTI